MLSPAARSALCSSVLAEGRELSPSELKELLASPPLVGEIRASDCSWPEISFESPREAELFARSLEERLSSPSLSPKEKEEIEDQLEDLFSALFDGLL
jgi:hypothetical protein